MPGYGYGAPVKTSTPRTLGTLSMVFGGIVTATSLFSVIAGRQIGNFSVQPGQREAFDAYVNEIHGYSMVQGTIMLLMSIALFYIGTGQRSYKRWAVGASVKWSLVAFAVIVFNAIGTFVWVLPAMDHLLAHLPHGNVQTQSMAMGMKVGLVMGLGVNLPYPIILLSTFRKPAIVAAMDQPSLPVAEVRV
jgi:hypothetical protein